MAPKVKRIMTQPIVRGFYAAYHTHTHIQHGLVDHTLLASRTQNLIFRFLQSRQKIQIWLYDQKDLRIEGRLIVRELLCEGVLVVVDFGCCRRRPHHSLAPQPTQNLSPTHRVLTST